MPEFVFGDRTSEEGIKAKRVYEVGLESLLEEPPESSFSLLESTAMNQKVTHLPAGKPSPDHKPATTFLLAFLTAEQSGNNFLSFKPVSLWYFVIAVQVD